MSAPNWRFRSIPRRSGLPWRLAPGSATGHHIHEMDYVIVPVTSGEMTIVAPGGERSKAQLGAGKSYSARPASNTTSSMS